jgi:hypothetical protein
MRRQGTGAGAHREVGEVVGEVRHVVEDVSEVPLRDLDVRGVAEADGGRVAERAEVGVRVAGDPHARRGEGQRRRRRCLVGGAAALLLLVILTVLVIVFQRQDDVRRHPGESSVASRSRGERSEV